MSIQDHWETVYETKSPENVGWYQPKPTPSLQMIDQSKPDQGASIIDVGGGASSLVDHIVADGKMDITVLDIAEHALDQSRLRLGKLAGRVDWIASDITRFAPQKQWDIWHDRAVFHFLTGAADRKAYREALSHGLKSGGQLIMATFSLDGPEKCSGLPIVQYSRASLSAEMGSDYRLLESMDYEHHTPGGNSQQFIYCRFEKLR